MEDYFNKSKNICKIIKCQAIFRGEKYRKTKLPNSLLMMQKILRGKNIRLCNKNYDGRLNSCMDEDEIVKILLKNMNGRIIKAKLRMWYDILVYDYLYGWLPDHKNG